MKSDFDMDRMKMIGLSVLCVFLCTDLNASHSALADGHGTLVSVAADTVPADGTVRSDGLFTLEDCRSMALENNTDVRNARLEYLNSVDTRKSLFTKFFPEISAGGAYFCTDNGAAKFVIIPGLAFPVGKDGVMGGVTAVQPVFAGGRIVAGNKLAGIGEEVGRMKVDIAERETSRKVDEYYWTLVSLKEKRKVVVSAEELVDNLYRDVCNLVDAGVCTRNDLLDVMYARNEIMSRRLELENGTSLARLALCQYIGVDASGPFDVDSVLSLPVLPPESYRTDHDEALGGLVEHHLLEASVKAKKMEYLLKVGEYMPTVGIGVGYQYQNLLNVNHSFGSVFATVTVPISKWWEGSYEARKKQREMEIAENQARNADEMLVLRMQKVWNEMELAYSRISLARNALDIAKENYELDRRNFDAGMISMSELMDTGMKYIQSVSDELDARIAYSLKVQEYLDVTGKAGAEVLQD